MFSWAKQTLAQTLGTEEPIYGSEAIRSVHEDAKTTPYTELKREDFAWAALDVTNVETQTFYLMADNGHLGMFQLIYSNVAGIRITCQFNGKVFYPQEDKPLLWSSTPLVDHEFSEDKLSFYAENVALELTEDGNSYTIKSMADEDCIVNLKVTKTAPGFVAGKDGTSYFGTDLSNPWGSMRHAFWPRCVAEGTVLTKDGPIDYKGKAFFVHALLGMKPHHAAARWNFVDFQGPTYSAVLMEYTTPASYGTTIVPVGGIAKNGEIICAGTNLTAIHTKTSQDDVNDWPEPTDVKYTWAGETKDGKAVEASMEAAIGKRLDRIDVMDEVPGFVKTIIASAVGTRPYIYQYCPKQKVTLKMKIGDEEINEEGILFCEATFISLADYPGNRPE